MGKLRPNPKSQIQVTAEPQNFMDMKYILTSTIRPWPTHEFLIEVISNSTKGDEEFETRNSEQEMKTSINDSESGKKSEKHRLTRKDGFTESDRQWTFPIIADRKESQNVKNASELKTVNGNSHIPLIVLPIRRYQTDLTQNRISPTKVPNVQINTIQKRVMTSSIPLTFTADQSNVKAETISTSNPQVLLSKKPIKLVFESSPQVSYVEQNNSKQVLIRNKQSGTAGALDNVPLTKVAHSPTTIFYRPIINHYISNDNSNKNTTSHSSLSTSIDLSSTTTTSKPTTIQETSVEANTSDSEIRFKIWSFVDGDLNLLSEKKVPSWVVGGANYSDGEIMNLETIPNPLRSMVHSALNYSGTVTKRHSGPGNDYHWQRLPVLESESSSWNTPKPVSPTLNYVLWSNKEKQKPSRNPQLHAVYPGVLVNNHKYNGDKQIFQTATLAPPPFKDAGLESWIRIQCELLNRMKNKTPSLESQYQELANREKEIWNSILLELASSKNLGNPNSEFSNSGFTHTINDDTPVPTPNPQHEQFWASLYPIYQNLVKTGTPYFTSTTPFPTIKYKAQRPTFYTESPPIDEYNFYSSNEADYSSDSAPPRKTFRKKPKKTLKKKIKKAKKIAKKFKKKKGKFSFLDPDKFQFNYAFGIDLLSIFKKLFFTILAFKTAPLIILTFLAVIPLLLLFWPKVLKYIALGHSIYHLKHSHQNIPGNYGWNPSQPYRGDGWDVQHHYHGQGYPVNDIGTLVQSSYGDPILPRELKNIKVQSEPVEYYDPELDTQHNRKVMEILMNSKNATLEKLLDHWSLERRYMNTTNKETK